MVVESGTWHHGYTGKPATPDDGMVAFVARK
jgi:hypothetical protein